MLLRCKLLMKILYFVKMIVNVLKLNLRNSLHNVVLNYQIFHFRKSLKEGWLDWNFLSHGGLSTSFSRALTKSASGNSSFTFDLEVAGLLMKKTKVELVMMRENGVKSYLAEVLLNSRIFDSNC